MLDGSSLSMLQHFMSTTGTTIHHNPFQPADVNGDSQVSIADLAALSKDLRTNGARTLNTGGGLAGAAGEGAANPIFVDVNGDDQASLADLTALSSTLRLGSAGQVDMVEVFLVVTDLGGTPITQANIGDTFVLHMRVDDLRTGAGFPQLGVGTAYVDVTYNAALASAVGNVTWPDWYNEDDGGAPGNAFNTLTDFSVGGEINDFGATVSGSSPWNAAGGLESLVPAQIPSIPMEVISIRMMATAQGLVTFQANNPLFLTSPNGLIVDISVQDNPIAPFDPKVPFDDVIFGSVQLNIVVDGVAAVDDGVLTLEGSSNIPFPIGGPGGLLDNDLEETPGTLEFVGLVSGTTSEGGTVTVVGSDVRYTPLNPNFYGTDTFQYQIRNSADITQTDIGTVTVTVTPVNDPPNAVTDTFNSAINTPLLIPFADIILNDWAGDIGDALEQADQTLTVTQPAAVIATTAGGTAVISGSNILYTPPSAVFVGPDSFLYRILDNGALPLFDDGIININVGINAVADAYIVQQGTSGTVLDVLSNDAPASSTVVAPLSVPTNGGTAVIGAGGANVVYDAPAIPVGQLDSVISEFDYTIDDGAGNNATAHVTVTVNAPPDAIDDGTSSPLLVVQNSSNNNLLVLDNDLVGAGETKVLDTTYVITAAHGTAFINGSNQLIYTPTPGYFGLDQLTYRLSDGTVDILGNPGTDIATVFINVIAPPSTISGIAYFDVDNDGHRDAPTSAPVGSTDPAKYIALHTESAMAGVTIQLFAGSSATGAPSQTTVTDHQGKYSFTILLPGTYTLKQVQPRATTDGIDAYDPAAGQPPEIVGISAAANSLDDTITFTIVAAVAADGFNFGEHGLSGPFVNVNGGYLTSTPPDSLTAAYNLTTGQQLWYSFRVSTPGTAAVDNWDLYNSFNIVLTQDNAATPAVDETNVELELTETATGDVYHTTFGRTNSQFKNFKTLGQSTVTVSPGVTHEIVVVRFNGPIEYLEGSPAVLKKTFTLVPGAAPEADDEETNLIDSFFSGQ